MPPRSGEGHTRGYIVPIGGAEEKITEPAILARFVELCGGAEARIAIIPTASQKDDTGPRYAEVFQGMGVADARVLPFLTRADCERADLVAELEHANGVFLTGGSQLRLSTTLGGTATTRALRQMNAHGVHVAGTSAGAAFLCEHMIARGDEGSTPRADMVNLAPGLGLTNHIIIDQHFRQRDRLGRLLTAIAYNPFAVGVGLDEDTAAFIDPDGVLEVLGSGSITVVDPSDLEYSSMSTATKSEPVCMIGVRLHVLVNGVRYDTRARVAIRG
ncbi:MAG TPA: cyanophycinase [Longimicrobiaceae bacterium]|nr:cyanophycinase [Longimicrobiaceae bacterium]